MDALPVATEIVQTLRSKGFIAYFAGGWVRDFLMGHPSDDIDIATTATPEEVIALFPKTIEVGKAFGVVIVVADGHQFEVASFRKEGRYLDGRKPESIELATPEEDAHRRDFTINGMFYDPTEEEILDFVGGQEDLQKEVIRAVGNPHERFVEDRLRMIRAVRFSSRFGFAIEPETDKAIRKSAPSLYPSVSVERVWQELTRMAGRPGIVHAIMMLFDFGLLKVIFPGLEEMSSEELEVRLAPLREFPAGTPAILYYARLFPHESLVQQFEPLKISGREKKLLEYFEQARDAGALELEEWAHLYAHKDAEIVFEVLGHSRGDLFREEHERRQQQLAPHIERVRNRTPLVSASDLKALGIAAGPKMGELLREAERIAIHEDLHDKELLLARLREVSGE